MDLNVSPQTAAGEPIKSFEAVTIEAVHHKLGSLRFISVDCNYRDSKVVSSQMTLPTPRSLQHSYHQTLRKSLEEYAGAKK